MIELFFFVFITLNSQRALTQPTAVTVTAHRPFKPCTCDPQPTVRRRAVGSSASRPSN